MMPAVPHRFKSRKRRISVWLAVMAMCSQVLFGAAHAASMAATAFGPLVLDASPSVSFGLLEICTATLQSCPDCPPEHQ